MLATSPELVLEILDMLAIPLAFHTDDLPASDRALPWFVQLGLEELVHPFPATALSPCQD
jgi:hypothetical protein